MLGLSAFSCVQRCRLYRRRLVYPGFFPSFTLLSETSSIPDLLTGESPTVSGPTQFSVIEDILIAVSHGDENLLDCYQFRVFLCIWNMWFKRALIKFNLCPQCCVFSHLFGMKAIWVKHDSLAIKGKLP